MRQPPQAPSWASCSPADARSQSTAQGASSPQPLGARRCSTTQGAPPPPRPASSPSGHAGRPAQDLCRRLPGARASGFPGGCVAGGAGESRWESQPQRYLQGGTLTDTALSILLELELGAALAAVPGHRELDTVMLAAPVPQGAGVYGWGHRQARRIQPRGMTSRGTHPHRAPTTSRRILQDPHASFLSVSVPEAGLRGAHRSYRVHGPGFAAWPTCRVHKL